MGVPVFVRWPVSKSPISEYFQDGSGYYIFTEWQHTSPDPCYLDAWREGCGLSAVMGHGLDCIDIDPRNGGSEDALGDLLPRVYARASTPSGGTHLFIKSLGVRSKDAVLPGVDLKAGAADGSGRGKVEIAPTRKESKATGERLPYIWEWVRLPVDASDESGAALRAHVEAIAPKPRAARKSGNALTRMTSAETDTRINGLIMKALSAVEGERNRMLYWASRCFADIINESALEVDDARNMLTELGAALGQDARSTRNAIRQGLRAGGVC